MAQHVVITGASGYIGTQLVAYTSQRGCEVVVLGSRPAGFSGRVVHWRLGEPLPADALRDAQAVIHLGHSWQADNANATDDNLNLTGAIALARAAIAGGVPRFVFASTTSARPQALNAYGRIKFAIEEQLRALSAGKTRVTCARIGLVYGGPEQGMYGLMARLASLSPVLPMIGLDREIQPIHVDEVCVGLLRLALDPPQGRDTFVLASAQPITFAEWLRTLRRARTGRGLRLAPISMQLALLACDLTQIVPFAPKVSRERVLGLAGAAPMDGAADLAALGISPRDPRIVLAQTPAARRRLIADAATMLRYVGGAHAQTFGALKRLTRALARDPDSNKAVPVVARLCPGLLRLFEPVQPSMRHALSRHLHLAAMVAESQPRTSPQPGLFGAGVQGVLDIAALPLRLLFNRICA